MNRKEDTNKQFYTQIGKVVHSALPARPLEDDTHTSIIITDCEKGNAVSAQGVGDNVPLVTVDLG